MLKLKIFEDAFHLYQGGFIELKSLRDRSASFDVDGKRVMLEYTNLGLKYQCECDAHAKHMVQDKLCKRVIAAIVFTRFRKEQIKLPLIELASIFLDCNEVWLDKVFDKKANFLIDKYHITIEKTQSGTKFVCDCNHHKHAKIQDKLCSYVIAVLLYIYKRRGRIKDAV